MPHEWLLTCSYIFPAVGRLRDGGPVVQTHAGHAIVQLALESAEQRLQVTQHLVTLLNHALMTP